MDRTVDREPGDKPSRVFRGHEPGPAVSSLRRSQEIDPGRVLARGRGAAATETFGGYPRWRRPQGRLRDDRVGRRKHSRSIGGTASPHPQMKMVRRAVPSPVSGRNGKKKKGGEKIGGEDLEMCLYNYSAFPAIASSASREKRMWPGSFPSRAGKIPAHLARSMAGNAEPFFPRTGPKKGRGSGMPIPQWVSGRGFGAAAPCANAHKQRWGGSPVAKRAVKVRCGSLLAKRTVKDAAGACRAANDERSRSDRVYGAMGPRDCACGAPEDDSRGWAGVVTESEKGEREVDWCSAESDEGPGSLPAGAAMAGDAGACCTWSHGHGPGGRLC